VRRDRLEAGSLQGVLDRPVSGVRVGAHGPLPCDLYRVQALAQQLVDEPLAAQLWHHADVVDNRPGVVGRHHNQPGQLPPQAYTRLADQRYRYESLDGSGFSAELAVDADGLVLDYPGLFRRVPVSG
jgi:hypothetical protein